MRANTWVIDLNVIDDIWRKKHTKRHAIIGDRRPPFAGHDELLVSQRCESTR